MPNHFCSVGLSSVDWDQLEKLNLEEPQLKSLQGANLCELAAPLPRSNSNSLNLARRHWGTKWGTYETEVTVLPGDGCPVLIQFQSVWGPPSGGAFAAIEEFLFEHYALNNFIWMGYDPFDDSVSLIRKAENSPPPKAEPAVGWHKKFRDFVGLQCA